MQVWFVGIGVGNDDVGGIAVHDADVQRELPTIHVVPANGMWAERVGLRIPIDQQFRPEPARAGSPPGQPDG